MLRRRTFLASAAAALAAPTVHAQTAAPRMQTFEQTARVVQIRETYAPGEIHVFPDHFSLYWTMPNNEAIRYPVGVARQGLYTDGTFWVRRKAKWPSWTPTPAMIKREPEIYKKYEDGMPGGPSNPLGARALYLYTAGGRDTYLRIHGTQDPGTIGRPVSNGCARLTNEYVTDLYRRVPIGTKVILHPRGGLA